MTRFKFLIVSLVIGLSFPLAIGFAAAQYDPYAPPRPRPSSNSLTKGVEAYDYKNNANTRLGTACRLKIEGEDVFPSGAGICNISRGVGGDRERTTIIDTGSRKLKIVRDEFDRHEGVVFGAGDVIKVFASGSCWRGAGFLFCAN